MPVMFAGNVVTHHRHKPSTFTIPDSSVSQGKAGHGAGRDNAATW